jgi:sulfur relay (sulfurtransferase) complex TusBCD TusD component (DsrE family)
MEYLLFLNDSPYGSQRTYNALRLGGALAKGATIEVSIFLLGDGVVCGVRMQSPADASYNVQEMLRLLASQVSQSVPAALVWKRVGLTMPRSSLASTAAPWTIFALGQKDRRRCSVLSRRRMRRLQNIEQSQPAYAGAFGTGPS